ncbi:MAG: DUF4505 family protein [Leptonema sp. (in: bacteria)]
MIERIYFYRVDPQGNLYFQDSLLTDKNFLNFFFNQIQYNTTGKYKNYKYISPCGKEMNFIECTDTPIVFRKLEEGNLVYAGDLKIPFYRENLVYLAQNSQLYYKFINKKKQTLYGRIGKHLLQEMAMWITINNEEIFFKDLPIKSYKTLSDLFL